jgi:hypothetical protein
MTVFSRSGEWGDHVTLQAAADKVGSLTTQLCSDHYFRSLLFPQSIVVLQVF